MSLLRSLSLLSVRSARASSSLARLVPAASAVTALSWAAAAPYAPRSSHFPPTRAALAPVVVRSYTSEADTIHEQIDKFVKSNDLVLFMKGTPQAPMCGFSRAVAQILEAQGVKEYAHVNVLEDETMRQGAKSYSNWPTFPQVYVKGEFIGGCDIMIDMFKSGDLNKLLISHKIIPDNGSADEKKDSQ